MIKDWREGRIATCRAGNLKRDYMHVDDIADALVAAALSREEGIMNIASGKSAALGDLARTLAVRAGKEDALRIGGVVPGPGNPEDVYADVTRMQRVYAVPERTFDENFSALLRQL